MRFFGGNFRGGRNRRHSFTDGGRYDFGGVRRRNSGTVAPMFRFSDVSVVIPCARIGRVSGILYFRPCCSPDVCDSTNGFVAISCVSALKRSAQVQISCRHAW